MASGELLEFCITPWKPPTYIYPETEVSMAIQRINTTCAKKEL
jgi:hypothetical protein